MKLGFICALVTVLVSSNASAQTSAVKWYTFDAGFGSSASLNTSSKSAIGQSLIGITLQANTQVVSGFLADTLLRGTLVTVQDRETPPLSYALLQNYPNPFNPVTIIRYELPEKARVTLTIYNVLGQEVARLVDTEQPSGGYEVRFDAQHVASGIYFYTIRAGTFAATRKLIVLK